MKRVVITGIGCISSIGLNMDEFCASLFQGNVGIGPISLFNTEKFRAKVAAEIKGYDEIIFFEKKQLTLFDRYAQFAMLSAREAVNDAQIVFDGTLQSKTAIILGSGISSQTTQDNNYYKLYCEKTTAYTLTQSPKL